MYNKFLGGFKNMKDVKTIITNIVNVSRLAIELQKNARYVKRCLKRNCKELNNNILVENAINYCNDKFNEVVCFDDYTDRFSLLGSYTLKQLIIIESWVVEDFKIVEYCRNVLVEQYNKVDGNCKEIIKYEYKYTYKSRGFSPGCQPKDFVKAENEKDFKFEVLTYNRKLTDCEINEFELIDLN
jgi:hypothetical protein